MMNKKTIFLALLLTVGSPVSAMKKSKGKKVSKIHPMLHMDILK